MPGRGGAFAFGGRSSRSIRPTCSVRGIPVPRCSAGPPLPSDGSVKSLSKEAMMQRLAKAREYKSKPAVPPPPSPAPPTTDESDAIFAALDSYAIQKAQEESGEFLQAQAELAASRLQTPDNKTSTNPSSPESLEKDYRAFRAGAGSADRAANWLQTFATEGTSRQLDTNMRPEEFTIKKEEARKASGVKIERAKGKVTGTRRTFDDDGYGLVKQQDEAEASIAAERAAAEEAKARLQAAMAEPMASGTDAPADMHAPAVATWGVFPRPRNMSEAYGGGRNLRPGQALETTEEAAERERRVSSALSNYRRSIGLEIDPEVEAEATALYEVGESEFKAGRVTVALDRFSAAAELVPLRSKIGGMASLQKAICLDSLGKNREAYGIYKSLKGHTAPGVAKSAKRMLFGFTAAENLKVSTMQFGSGGAPAWQSYFDRFNVGTWAEYGANDEKSEEDKESERMATLVATAVVLVPLIFAVVLITRK